MPDTPPRSPTNKPDVLRVVASRGQARQAEVSPRGGGRGGGAGARRGRQLRAKTKADADALAWASQAWEESSLNEWGSWGGTLPDWVDS